MFAQKYIVLLNILQRIASTSLCSQQWTQEGKATKIQTQVSLQKQANSSYGKRIMDRSQHTPTKNLSDEKTHAAINSKLFKNLDQKNDSLYEVELAKAQIEHNEPIIVGLFTLQYANLLMLELHYNFFTKLCDVNKFEELEMDTDSLYLAFAEKELEDCFRTEMRAEWQRLRSNDCGSFHSCCFIIFLPPNMSLKTQTRESLASSKKTLAERRCYVCVVRHTVAMTLPLINLNLAVSFSLNMYWNRAATDHRRSIVES